LAVIGTLLAGRYRVDRLIGRGSLGEVWHCVDEMLGRPIAAKVFTTLALDQAEIAERIALHWTRVATKFDHPGVVHVYESGHDPQAGAYVIMEYVPGESLSEVLARDGRLTPARTMEIVAQAADGLAALHRWGLVHRDLRPGRILVRDDGTVVLGAFSLSRYVRPLGSFVELDHPHYLSPEQAMGDAVSIRTDIYVLGVIAYECLTGRRPFEGDQPLEVAMRIVREEPPSLPTDVPQGIRSVVERALAKKESSRWPSADALAAAATSWDEPEQPRR
jgi:serine/threonine-protein kinase